METLIGPQSENSPGRKLRLLSLDGGGVRGLSCLLVLRSLMHHLSMELGLPTIKPCEYFDMIGGTSTGGIIALMLGRLRMSVQECIAEYTRLSQKIFSKKRSDQSSKASFYAEVLEDAIKEVIIKRYGPDKVDEPLLDPLGPEACKTFVLSLQRQHATIPHYLKTYECVESFPCTIWQATRATSAAETIFDPIRFGNPEVEWTDAALGWNNPASKVREEAEILWKKKGRPFDSQIGIFISLGTGIPTVFRPDAEKSSARTMFKNEAKRLGIHVDAIKLMKQKVLDAETVHWEFKRHFQDYPDVYHRFNVKDIGNIGLGEYESEEFLAAATNAYLERKKYNFRECAKLMKEYPLNIIPLESQRILQGSSNLSGIAIARERGLAPMSLPSTLVTIFESLNYCPEPDLSPIFDDALAASALDHRACKRLSDFYKTDVGVRASRKSDESAVVMEHVHKQLESNKELAIAHRLYRKVCQFTYPLRRQHIAIRASFLWSVHRLAGVSERLGFLEDALSLYEMAWKGRQRWLHEFGECVTRSKEGMERVKLMMNKR